MSVLMRGVDMPKNCEECNFKGECRDYWVRIREAYTRPSWCPLVEVNCSEIPNNCEACKNWDTVNDHCYFIQECRYEPKTEPQTDCPKTCPSRDICTRDTTDCAWK